MPKVSDAHKQAVRQSILDAAYRIIEHGDFSNLTTRSIIEEAGISNGTLYHYFPSIDHLYAELAEAGLRGAMAGIVRAPEGPGADEPDASDAVGRLVRWLRHDMLGDRELAEAVALFRSRIELGDMQREAVEGLNRYAVAQFGDLVRHLQAEGSFREDVDADALVEMIDFLWDGLGRRQAAGTFQTSYDRAVTTIIDVLLNGVLRDDVASPPAPSRTEEIS
jgi:AcrR family transcriptional regulator